MIVGSLEMPDDVEAAFSGLSDDDIRSAIHDALQDANGPGGVMERHWQDGQGKWDENEPEYNRRKGDSPKFVNTGDALDAMTNKGSEYRRVKVNRTRKNGSWRGVIYLEKIVNGKNVYAIAQAGKKGIKKPMLISANLPGDQNIVMPYLVAALTERMKKKGLL